MELYILSCGDVHHNPGHTHRKRASNASDDNNAPLQSRKQGARKLSGFYANARRSVNKIAKLQIEIVYNYFDVIVLTETHLDSSITDIEIFGREYCIYRKDRQQEGGANCHQRMY